MPSPTSSHLANLAEDRHHIRRRAIHERAGDTQDGSIEGALARLRWAGITAKTVSHTLAQGYLSPVLTAHPTEVQRKEHPRCRARHRPPAGGARRPSSASGRRRATRRRSAPASPQLWQTRMLRFTKLTVADEIENALSYYRATFLAQIPELYREIEEALRRLRDRALLPHGQLDRRRPRRQPHRRRRDAGYALRAPERDRAAPLPRARCTTSAPSCRCSATCRRVTPELQALADASGDASPHRADEPYRRALIGVYARLAATLYALTGTRGAAPRGDAEHTLPRRGGTARRPAHRRGVASPPSRRGPDRSAPARR